MAWQRLENDRVVVPGWGLAGSVLVRPMEVEKISLAIDLVVAIT